MVFPSKGGVLLDKRVTDSRGFTEKTVAEVLAGKHPPERQPRSYTLEAYKETPVLFPWILQRM